MNSTLEAQLSDIPKTAMNALPASIAVLDGSGEIVWVNASWRNFAVDHGLQADDILTVGESYTKLCQRRVGMSAQQSDEICAGIGAVLRGDEPEFTREVSCHRHGIEHWYTFSVVPLQPDHSGAILLRLDITPQKQAERAAREAARRFTLLDQVSVAFAQPLDDLQSLLDAITREIAEAFGASCILRLINEAGDRLEPVSMHHPEQQKHCMQQAPDIAPLRTYEAIPGQVFQTGKPVNTARGPDTSGSPMSEGYAEFRKAHKYGAVLIVPVGARGRVLGTLGILRSESIPFNHQEQELLEELAQRAALAVDGSRLYDEALRAQEQLRTVVEHVPAIVYSAAMDETISTTYINPQVEELLGYPPQAFLDDDQFWSNHLHPDDRKRVVHAMDQLQFGVPLDEEYRMITANGDIVWLRDRAGFIRDDSGRPALIQGVAIDVTARKRFDENQARQLRRAFHDPLTDLPNRSLFVDRVAHALGSTAHGNTKLGIMQIEIDRFKTINDSLGRSAGDQLLRALSARLRECTQPGDTLARLGGDEFGILLEQSDEAEVIAIAQRINAALADAFMLAGRETFVSTSIGVTVGHPQSDSPDDLMHNADVALHEAKRRGGGRLELFDPSMRARVLERMVLETELRQALDRDELLLHYQPKVDLATREIVAFEALIRWEHPTRGLIGADAFIPLAEENGLILPIGDWVMREACRQARVWSDTVEGFRGVTVDLNLSARQFQQPGLLDESRRILRDTSLPADRIGLEITESAVMDDADLTIELFRGLKGLGFRLAIDDFGTGYSSLAYLKRFPVDVLKIDRSFIAGLEEEENQAIVSSVIHLAHALKMRVTAEGIEEAAQAEQMHAMRCDTGQGYYFARPLPPARVPALLGNG